VLYERGDIEYWEWSCQNKQSYKMGWEIPSKGGVMVWLGALLLAWKSKDNLSLPRSTAKQAQLDNRKWGKQWAKKWQGWDEKPNHCWDREKIASKKVSTDQRKNEISLTHSKVKVKSKFYQSLPWLMWLLDEFPWWSAILEILEPCPRKLLSLLD
jgi:hypothetical protein